MTIIYVILRAPKLKTVTIVFILNLAITDSLFMLVQRWPFRELLCKLVLAIDHYNIFSSVYLLAAMRVDRYLVVLATTRSHRVPWRTLRGTKITSLCICLGVSILVLPFLAFAGFYGNELKVASCGLSFPQPEQAWSGQPHLHAGPGLCGAHVHSLRALRGPSAPALGPEAPVQSQGSGQGQAEGDHLGPGCAGCETALLDTLPPGLRCGPGHRPAPDITGYWYLLSYASSCLNPFLCAILDSSFHKSFHSRLQCREA
ncbi:hypothetical protein MC885_005775 [Smutsia gigantea]|nr:hypothetical protein MC885_005775 [Smutsia gigantea]